ncbi:MAG: hypothetical protein ABIT83_03445 [Massilia sp.]
MKNEAGPRWARPDTMFPALVRESLDDQVDSCRRQRLPERIEELGHGAQADGVTERVLRRDFSGVGRKWQYPIR